MRDYSLEPNGTLIHRMANLVGSDIYFGDNCRVDAFVTITGHVVIGNNVHIGVGVSIFGSHGVVIGDGVSLSPGSKIFTNTDDPSLDLVTNPQLKERCGQIGQVSIGNYSSIGCNSVVLPGLTIDDQVQVGALSLVKNSLRGHSVYAGIPARYIGPRKELSYGNNPGKP